MDLISVIVPVYKVEQYLDRCVQSIVDQTYRNLEIILVDDGSPDNCGYLCDNWAQKDPRIKVIHKENGGSAQARNVGLSHAAGEYLAFVDSDDFILPDMYAALMETVCQTSCDIAECGYHTVETDAAPPGTTVPKSLRIFTAEEALGENIRDHICRQLVWNKLYRRSVVDGVRFVENRFIDDEFFTYRVLGNAKTVAVISDKFYCYRQQQGSAMHQHYSRKWLDAVDAKLFRLQYVSERYPSLREDAQISLLFTCMYHGQLALKHLKTEEQQQVFCHLRNVVSLCSVPSRTKLSNLSFTHRCWLWLASVNLIFCCRLRNFLKIGC